jgi:hypothetical protein
MQKRCPKCGEIKDMDAFGFHRDRPDKKQHWCKDCHKEYRDTHKSQARITRHRYFVANKKAENQRSAEFSAQQYRKMKAFTDPFHTPCDICGKTSTLHFHHIDPATKLYSISQMRFCSKAEVLTEIAKCISVCNHHHRLIHIAMEMAKKAGELFSYEKFKKQLDKIELGGIL